VTNDASHPFQIAVCPTTGWAEPVIEWATKGKYTHSYLVLADRTYSMEPDGLVEREFGFWGENSAYSNFETTADEQRAIVKYITDHAHLEYDYIGDEIVGLDDVTPRFMDPFWHVIEHFEDKMRPDHAFCSAFSDATFTSAGIKVFDDGRPSRAVTPMDLWRMFKAQGWVTA